MFQHTTDMHPELSWMTRDFKKTISAGWSTTLWSDKIDTFVVQENSGLPATNSETTHPEFFGEVDNYNLYRYLFIKNLKKNSKYEQFHSIGKSPL